MEVKKYWFQEDDESEHEENFRKLDQLNAKLDEMIATARQTQEQKQ